MDVLVTLPDELAEQFEALAQKKKLSPSQHLLRLVKRVVAFEARNLCLECRKPVYESYMVQQPLWRQAVPERKGVMHLTCLEKRLGRALTPQDFPQHLPINTLLHLGVRMGQR